MTATTANALAHLVSLLDGFFMATGNAQVSSGFYCAVFLIVKRIFRTFLTGGRRREIAVGQARVAAFVGTIEAVHRPDQRSLVTRTSAESTVK